MHFEARRFYLFLSIASLLTIISYLFILVPSSPIVNIHTKPSPATWSQREKFAYATFLGPPTSRKSSENLTTEAISQQALQDPYFISVRLQNYQIHHAEKTRTTKADLPFLVLVLPQVPKTQVAILKEEGATIIPVEPLELPDAFDKNFINTSRFRDVLSKLRLWQLTEYSKILYLDADSFLLQNLDAIFTDSELSTPMKNMNSNQQQADPSESAILPPETYLMAASADTYGDQTEWEEPGHVNYLCACFMLFSPSDRLFDYYVSVLTGPDAPPNAAYPEQDLLISVHRQDGPMPWRRIPVQWSANDGEMNDEYALFEGVKSLHVKGWEGAEGGNVANEKYKGVWKQLVEEMYAFYSREGNRDTS